MKTYIRKLKELHLLKRNTKLKSDNFYILQSESTGSVKYFESKEEIRYAKQIFRKNFAGMIEIISELYTSAGFILGVRIQTSGLIQESWKERGKEENEDSFILSEVLRYSISAITKRRNFMNGRKGSVVRENFRTYKIENESQIGEIIKKKEVGGIELSGQEGRYRIRERGKGVWVFWKMENFADYVLRKLKLDQNPSQNPTPNLNSNPLSPP